MTYSIMEQRALILNKGEQSMNLLPGFRFHPTDEELISFYLLRKAMDASFSSIAIGDVDLIKFEPWELPERANMGEKEWYFFCMKDRKYPTGTRANRATGTGYWKSTGKDKAIHNGKTLVGMKKTLVFYTGRAPRGEKSDWVMHEYRLEGKYTTCTPYQNEWVVCRVFKKTAFEKKATTQDENMVDSGSDMATHVTHFSSHEELFAKYCMNNYLCNSYNPNSYKDGSSSSLIVEEGREREGLVQVLQGNVFYELKQANTDRGKEIVTSSLDTGLTTEINQEISSLDESMWSY